MLEISIFSAEGLPNVDGFMAGKSDPYVVCGVPGQGRQAIQTKPIDNNLNPTWDHTEVLHDWQVGEPIEFAVFDSNAVKADKLLGKAFLQSEQFFPNGVEGTVPLGETEVAQGTLTIRVLVVEDQQMGADGQMELAGELPGEPTTICVDILSAKGLANTDGFMAGKSDPYVIVDVPGKPEISFKTPVISNNLDPVWNFRAELAGYVPGDPLEFTVMDNNSIMKDTFLGKFMLDSASFYPNGAVGDVTLQNKDGVEGSSTLEIAIHICPAASMPPLTAATAAAEEMVAAVAPTTAEMAPEVVEQQQTFEAIDTNHDGVLTQQEVAAAVTQGQIAPAPATQGRVTCVQRSVVPAIFSYTSMPQMAAPVAAVTAGTAPASLKTYAAQPVTYAAPMPAPKSVAIAPRQYYSMPKAASTTMVAPVSAKVAPAPVPAPAPAPVPAPKVTSVPAKPLTATYKAPAVTYAAPTAYKAPMTYAAVPKATTVPAHAMTMPAPVSTPVQKVMPSASPLLMASSRVSIGAATVAMPQPMPATAVASTTAMPTLRYQAKAAPVGSTVSFTAHQQPMPVYAMTAQPVTAALPSQPLGAAAS